MAIPITAAAELRTAASDYIIDARRCKMAPVDGLRQTSRPSLEGVARR